VVDAGTDCAGAEVGDGTGAVADPVEMEGRLLAEAGVAAGMEVCC